MDPIRRIDAEFREAEVGLATAALIRFLADATALRDMLGWLCEHSETYQRFCGSLVDVKVALNLPPSAFGMEVQDE